MNYKPRDHAYKQILYCMFSGKIQKSLEICSRNNLFSLSMLISQTNNPRKTNLIDTSIQNWQRVNLYGTFDQDLKRIYNTISTMNDPDIFDKETLQRLNWKNVMIGLSTFKLEPTRDINSVITTFDGLISRNRDIKNIAPISNKGFANINFILIKYLALLDNYNDHDQNKEISTQTLLSLCATENIFNHFADHHLHYIIVLILLNTLGESYSISNEMRNEDFNRIGFIDIKLLKHLHSVLLIKVVEELLIFGNWKYAISVIRNSCVPSSTQMILVKDIIFRFADVAKSDPIFSEIEKKFSKEALGCYHYSKFNYTEAYKQFKEAGNINKANDVLINYLSLDFHF